MNEEGILKKGSKLNTEVNDVLINFIAMKFGRVVI